MPLEHAEPGAAIDELTKLNRTTRDSRRRAISWDVCDGLETRRKIAVEKDISIIVFFTRKDSEMNMLLQGHPFATGRAAPHV